MHIVPTMFVRLLRLPDEVKRRYDVSSLRWITHGAAPCAPAVKRQMIEWWGPVITEYYGATETGVVVWHDSADALRKPGTVGRVVEGALLRIVDEDGNDVKQGEVGEIFVRGPHVSEFTYNNDADKRREAKAARMGFSAYAVTQGGDDPLAVALHRLIDHVAEQDRQIEALQQALKRMGAETPECCEPLDASELNRMVD